MTMVRGFLFAVLLVASLTVMSQSLPTENPTENPTPTTLTLLPCKFFQLIKILRPGRCRDVTFTKPTFEPTPSKTTPIPKL